MKAAKHYIFIFFPAELLNKYNVAFAIGKTAGGNFLDVLRLLPLETDCSSVQNVCQNVSLQKQYIWQVITVPQYPDWMASLQIHPYKTASYLYAF